MSRIDLYQLDDFNENFAPNRKHGDIPMWDDTNGEFVPIVRFGNNFFSECVDTPISTSGTQFITAISATTPEVPIGKYSVTYCGLVGLSGGNARMEIRPLENNQSLLPVNLQVAAASTDEVWPINCLCEVDVVAPRPISVVVSFRRQGANQTVTVYASRVRVYRIA
jgi:hypothetical protein